MTKWQICDRWRPRSWNQCQSHSFFILKLFSYTGSSPGAKHLTFSIFFGRRETRSAYNYNDQPNSSCPPPHLNKWEPAVCTYVMVMSFSLWRSAFRHLNTCERKEGIGSHFPERLKKLLYREVGPFPTQCLTWIMFFTFLHTILSILGHCPIWPFAPSAPQVT